MTSTTAAMAKPVTDPWKRPLKGATLPARNPPPDEAGQEGNREHDGRALIGADQASNQYADQEDRCGEEGAAGGPDHHRGNAHYSEHRSPPVWLGG